MQPRLSWQLTTNRRGARQTAYQIQVASSEAALQAGKADLWDSGRVVSDQSLHIVYDGVTLRSGQRAWWQVRVWDENDQPSDVSEAAWWEMGLLERTEWLGEWIGGGLVGSKFTTMPAPFLRKTFSLDKGIVSARLYATALGLYEASINGQRVGDDVFTPGWTDYRIRAQYHTYDVTALLQRGDNALGAILGDGWYCGHLAVAGRQYYGDRPKFLAQLVIQLADGTTQTIATDGSWKTSTGPIVESDFLMGESYDARLEMPGWNNAAFDESRWLPVQTFPDTGIVLTAAPGPTVRRQEELKPMMEPTTYSKEWNRTAWVYDLGQNMVGWVRLKVSGTAGATVRLRYAEALNPDGTIYITNLRSARSTDYYTLKGGGEEIYEPHFTFHGFRYVEVSGYPAEVPPSDAVTGIVLHSDTRPTGEFVTSDPMINQLQHNIVWGQKGNFVDVPTDCPQRDERLGWMGDAQVFIRTAAFNMDVTGFFTKWQQDITDAQTPLGQFPAVVPYVDVTYADGGPAWADAGVICPWTLYLCYGDKRLLETHYDSFTRYIDYLRDSSLNLIRCHPDLRAWDGFGDWLSIKADTPKELIGTAFFAYSVSVMVNIARALGRTADVEHYQQLFKNVREAFLNRFVTPGGLIVGHTQTAYVLALQFNLLPKEMYHSAVTELVRDIEKRNNHLSTGFVGSSYLPHALTQNGRLDLTYALLHQKTWPSWLYSVTKGGTTIWERWDGWTEENGFQDPGMNSFNHYAYGAIGAWMYAVIAGIDIDPAQPGYKRIIFRPMPGGGFTFARGALDSLYGRIVSEWHIQGGVFHWTISVPPNTTAAVYVPAGERAIIAEGGKPLESSPGITFVRREAEAVVYEVTSGDYEFVVAGE